MSKVRLCAETLSTGNRCTQFALRNQPWCRNHADPNHRERNEAARQLIAAIPGMDLFDIAGLLGNTIFELQRKFIPPRHARAVFDASLTRLDHLLLEISAASAPQQVPTANFQSSKELQNHPMK